MLFNEFDLIWYLVLDTKRVNDEPFGVCSTETTAYYNLKTCVAMNEM